MKELAIDIETYSSHDLTACGVYRYVEALDFEVLLFSYAIDGGDVQCVDLASGEELPPRVREALTSPHVVKTAYNAAFERVCLGRYLGTRLDPAQWECTMIRAARLGLPHSLGQCANVLKLEVGKMEEGRALIRLFSKPDSKGRRHLPTDDPEKWATFKRYNIRDVEVEQAILRIVRRLNVPDFERELYIADQEINDRGVLIDRELVENAARFDAEHKARLLEEAKQISGLENPNSPTQLKEWLAANTFIGTLASLSKMNLEDIEGRLQYHPTARRLLEIRRALGKTSNKKYDAMLECVCDDGRIRGLLQFYGAARTGRWAGRLVQVQNLPQNHLVDLDFARRLVKSGDLDDFELNYESPMQVLSELIRTAFVAAPGHTFHICDFSAIEARVIAWLAGEEWVLDVFRDGGDIYCATASQMFHVPVEKHGRNAGLRQKGKIAVLALGYGGGVAALEAMGGSRLGLSETEEREIIALWRDSNPKIVKLWARLENAAQRALRDGQRVIVNRGMTVERRWGSLLITLPSGRQLVYPRARIALDYENWRGLHETIEYEAVNQINKKWGTTRTYGGKLTENVVQAIARDILGEVILRARRERLPIVFHIHDEIIVEADGRPLSDVEAIFSQPIDWCPGLPMKGAGYSSPYYLKD